MVKNIADYRRKYLKYIFKHTRWIRRHIGRVKGTLEGRQLPLEVEAALNLVEEQCGVIDRVVEWLLKAVCRRFG